MALFYWPNVFGESQQEHLNALESHLREEQEEIEELKERLEKAREVRRAMQLQAESIVEISAVPQLTSERKRVLDWEAKQ